jgi:uncharacterized membrane protein
MGLEQLGLGLLAIVVMAATTFAMRAVGFWAMGHFPLTLRRRRMLEALPGSIVTAAVLPIAAKSGWAAVLAIAAALAVMIVYRNELLAIGVGVLVAALARSGGI